MNDFGPGGGENAVVPGKVTSQAIGMLLDGLYWIYDRAAAGGFGFSGAEERAKSYAAGGVNAEEAIDRLIRWSIAEASTAGFLSNLGGLMTLPVAIPANVGAALFIQLNMIATIAHLRGHDVRSDRVRTFALVCLAGNGAVDVLKNAGAKLGMNVAGKAIFAVPKGALTHINQAVGFRLVTKAGGKGLVNLSKLLPVLGGLVTGAIDGGTTMAIAKAAKKLFPPVTADAMARWAGP